MGEKIEPRFPLGLGGCIVYGISGSFKEIHGI
jgi:hypothetical protein